MPQFWRDDYVAHGDSFLMSAVSDVVVAVTLATEKAYLYMAKTE